MKNKIEDFQELYFQEKAVHYGRFERFYTYLTVIVAIALIWLLAGCSPIKAPVKPTIPPFETVVRIDEDGEVGYLKQAGVTCNYEKKIPVKRGEVWKFSSAGCKFEKIGGPK